MQSAVYIRAIRGSWLLIAVFVACGGIGLGALAQSREPVYTSEARLLVTFTPTLEHPSQQTSRLMQRLAKTYTTAVATPRVTEPVIGKLGLDTTPEELGEQITASSPVNSHEIRVTVTDTSAARAAAIVNALAAELGTIAARNKPSAELPANVGISVVSGASVPGKPEPVRWPLHALAGAFAGFGIGLGLAVLRGRRNDDAQTGVPLRR
ncbi:hypothetical protein GCM10022251_19270 [Phytohabitans flavus]|uniref:Polysaccharide chain length determinant N-terminal domain-containing protein n=1 Tax=Phytohabitans flavus TaxID=1076124 RepID=A0A6F8XZ11_9ACTN|nr:lipopolysaccharide biosynthesis protein [Phytohabitans flavus]BCB79102.1 hypothetical protein Pflav_055120 [Phytohabitans flavus]